MNPNPHVEAVFPLSVGSPERPALRPPSLSLTPQEAADFFAEFAMRAVGRRPAWNSPPQPPPDTRAAWPVRT